MYNDVEVFRQALKGRIPNGRRVIADRGYRGESDVISTHNEFDSRDMAEFKDRVLCRHETFNQRLKTYDCLTSRYRHGISSHEQSFKAVCVIVMYEIENGGTSLYDPYL